MKKFNLGNVFTTAGAAKVLTVGQLNEMLDRHVTGDWGEVPPQDAEENELSIEHGFRIMSVYTVNDRKMWVITEADRSSTTVLLPSEY